MDEKTTLQAIIYPAKEEEAEHGERAVKTNYKWTDLNTHQMWLHQAETVYFIDLMRQHLEEEGELPKNRNEQRNRVKMLRGKKKMLWKDMASNLSSQFSETFEPEKVQRKCLD